MFKINKDMFKNNKTLIWSTCTLLLLVSLSLVFSLTRCSKGDDVQDDTKYNTLGTNWRGYEDGELIMTLQSEDKTAYVWDSTSYKANNLVIPKSVFEDDIEYLIVPTNFTLNSNYITGTIEIPSTWEYIGGNGYISIYCPEADSVIIPKSVTTLRDLSINVKHLEIPDTVKTIQSFAFAECVNLISIIIPDSVKSIADYTFSKCSGLESVKLPDYMTAIGPSAFRNCTSLKSITIPNGVSTIRSNTFQNDSALEFISIPSSVAQIESYAFNGCSNTFINEEEETKRNLVLPIESAHAGIASWTSGNIGFGNITFNSRYWNIEKK